MNAIDYYYKLLMCSDEDFENVTGTPIFNVYLFLLEDVLSKPDIITMFSDDSYNNSYKWGAYANSDFYIIFILYNKYLFSLFMIDNDPYMSIHLDDKYHTKLDKYQIKDFLKRAKVSKLTNKINIGLDFLTFSLKILE